MNALKALINYKMIVYGDNDDFVLSFILTYFFNRKARFSHISRIVAIFCLHFFYNLTLWADLKVKGLNEN